MNRRIKQIKDSKNFTTQQLSDITGVPYRTIVNYERGKRKVSSDFLEAMAFKIGLDVNWFLTGEGEMFKGSTDGAVLAGQEVPQGGRLKKLRQILGLTQADMGAKIDIDQRNYTNYENGKAELKAKHIQKLVENFEINANWLLTGKGGMYISESVREQANIPSPTLSRNYNGMAYMELRKRIKLIENYLNITHKELADLLGVGENRIKQLSAGNLKALKSTEVLILVQKYGFNHNWLLTGEGEMLANNTVNCSPKSLTSDRRHLICCNKTQNIGLMMNLRLKLIRDTLKYSQKEFAEKINMSQATYSNYELGSRQIKAEMLDTLAHTFNVNINWLITGNGEMFTQNTAIYSPLLMQAIEDALSEIEEPELIEFIKEKTVAKIVEKLSIPKNLLSKAFNFLTYERPLIYLYLVFKSIKPYDDSIGHKEWIIKSISELDLLSFQNILGPAFNSYSKNHIIKRMEDLTEEECRVLLENTSQLQKHLEKNISISEIIS